MEILRPLLNGHDFNYQHGFNLLMGNCRKLEKIDGLAILLRNGAAGESQQIGIHLILPTETETALFFP